MPYVIIPKEYRKGSVPFQGEYAIYRDKEEHKHYFLIGTGDKSVEQIIKENSFLCFEITATVFAHYKYLERRHSYCHGERINMKSIKTVDVASVEIVNDWENKNLNLEDENKPAPRPILPEKESGPRGPLGRRAFICIPKGNAWRLYGFVKESVDELLREILRDDGEMKENLAVSVENVYSDIKKAAKQFLEGEE